MYNMQRELAHHNFESVSWLCAASPRAACTLIHDFSASTYPPSMRVGSRSACAPLQLDYSLVPFRSTLYNITSFP